MHTADNPNRQPSPQLAGLLAPTPRPALSRHTPPVTGGTHVPGQSAAAGPGAFTQQPLQGHAKRGQAGDGESPRAGRRATGADGGGGTADSGHHRDMQNLPSPRPPRSPGGKGSYTPRCYPEGRTQRTPEPATAPAGLTLPRTGKHCRPATLEAPALTGWRQEETTPGYHRARQSPQGGGPAFKGVLLHSQPTSQEQN